MNAGRLAVGPAEHQAPSMTCDPFRFGVRSTYLTSIPAVPIGWAELKPDRSLKAKNIQTGLHRPEIEAPS